MSTELNAQTVTTWSIDPAHTVVEFSAKHLMITTVRGQFGTVQGTVTVDEGDPGASVAEVEIDTTAIDTRSEQRDTHLRSADFLDVETFPVLRFRSTRIEGGWSKPGDTFKVHGELTIKDQTREVVLDATYEGAGKDPWGGERSSFSADTKIDRLDYGLTWNVGLETGGVLVSNDIRIHLEVQLVKAA